MNSEAPKTVSRPRVDWVDYSKGICIFFVVMLHCNETTQLYMKGDGWLQYVVEFARPFRMPDFFLIAGLFLASAIRKPWKVYLDRKVVHFLYFYALWVTFEFLLFDVRHAILDGEFRFGYYALEYVKMYVEPTGSLWFIHSLPIYFVLTRLLQRAPVWLVLPILIALQSSQQYGWLYFGHLVPDQFCLRYLFFYSGYVLAPHVFRFAGWALDNPRATVGLLLVWGVFEQFMVSMQWSKLPLLSTVLGYIGAGAVVLVAGLCTRAPRVMNFLRYIGEHSIVVYLAYYTAAQIAVKAVAFLVPDIGSAALLVTIASVALSVLAYRLTLDTPLGFMFTRPQWARLRLEARDIAKPATAAAANTAA